MMKLFLKIALLTQLVLLGASAYFACIANGILTRMTKRQEMDTLDISSALQAFTEHQYYNDLDNYLGYAFAVIWIIVVIMVNVKGISKEKLASLTIYLPLLINSLLMFI